ncbi:unnamed protein product [Gongylonema pulchrum]|uniref:PKcGMP_CC domain-containing protein n=1 Tax=Gongylonema pulchrum TaxID=637853 RepID=A0A183D3L5_9BILA|nr:unnamed protein product [Gongylonema pulchrum]
MSGSLYRSPSTALYKSPSMSAFGGPAPFGSMSVADLGSLTRLEDKIRLLQEDLESERELRNRVSQNFTSLKIRNICFDFLKTIDTPKHTIHIYYLITVFLPAISAVVGSFYQHGG